MCSILNFTQRAFVIFIYFLIRSLSQHSRGGIYIRKFDTHSHLDIFSTIAGLIVFVSNGAGGNESFLLLSDLGGADILFLFFYVGGLLC